VAIPFGAKPLSQQEQNQIVLPQIVLPLDLVAAGTELQNENINNLSLFPDAEALRPPRIAEEIYFARLLRRLPFPAIKFTQKRQNTS